jgi:hypothetical protein
MFTKYPELSTPQYHSVFQLRERHSGELLTDHVELHVVELPKLQHALSQNDEPSLTAWVNS